MQKSVDVLVVDSSMERQRALANGLFSEIHNVRVAPAESFHEVMMSLVMRVNLPKGFDAYVVRGPFPHRKGEEPQDLSVELAERIYDHERTNDKTFMVDSDVSRLLDAQRKGIHRAYYEGQQTHNGGIKSIIYLIPDLKRFLQLE